MVFSLADCITLFDQTFKMETGGRRMDVEGCSDLLRGKTCTGPFG